MRRGLLTLALLVVIAGATVAGVTAPDAQALGQPSPYTQLRSSGTSSGLWGAFKQLLRGQTGTATTYGTLMGGESTTTRNGMNTMLYRARVGSRFLPKLGLFATRLSLVGTAGYVAWRVYQHYNDDNDATVDMFIDYPGLGADALLNPAAVPATYGTNYHWGTVQWVKQAGATECGAIVGECFVLYFQPYIDSGVFDGGSTKPLNGGWQNSYPTGIPTASYFAGEPNFYRHVVRALDFDDCVAVVQACMNASPSGTVAKGQGLNYMITRSQENLIGRMIAGYPITDMPVVEAVALPTLPQIVTSHRLVIDADAIGEDLSVIGGTMGTPDVETTYEVPGNAGDTAPDVEKALDAFDSPCGRALINHLLQPQFYPWIPGCVEVAPSAEPAAETITVLRPLSTETYADYIIRLQAEGWLGVATLVELDPYDPLIGPEVVSKVGVTGQTGTWRRAVWPPVWPEIAADTDLTIYHNPDTAPPVAPDPTDEETPPGGGGVFDPGGCEPWLEATPDFSPLTGLNMGDAFPFALFGWVAGAIGAFNVSPEAPSWDFHIVIPATAVSSETDVGHFVVDLEVFDSYMSTIRAILTFVLWVGAVWYFATALLGFRAPGNPAEAVDEA